MLQNININGMNINGLLSNRSMTTVAAGCDLSTMRFDLGKPLSKTCVPHVAAWSYPTATRLRRSQQLHQEMHDGIFETLETTVAKPVALEPPAAAWASFVIARSTSV